MWGNSVEYHLVVTVWDTLSLHQTAHALDKQLYCKKVKVFIVLIKYCLLFSPVAFLKTPVVFGGDSEVVIIEVDATVVRPGKTNWSCSFIQI